MRVKAKNSICMAPVPVEKISLFPQDEIMFIKVTKKSNGKTSVRIMESTRIGEKTQQKTLMSLGCVHYAVEALKKTDQGLLIKIASLPDYYHFLNFQKCVAQKNHKYLESFI